MAERPPWIRGLRWIAGVLALAVLFAWTGRGAKGPARCDRVASTVALQMAGNAQAAANVRAEWQDLSGVKAQDFPGALRKALRWDFAFIVVYTLALVLACRAVARAARAWPWKRTAALAGMAALLAVAAAVLDVIENVALWKGLSNPATDTWPWLARACAIPKFVLIGSIVLFVLVATTFLTARRVKEDPETWPLPLLWLAPLGTWILSYPVLLGATALVLGVAWRALLVGLGIPDLFWHESMRYQFLAGLGTGLLTADLGLIGFLLDAPSVWMKRLGKEQGWPKIADGTVRALVRYLLLTSALIAAGVIASLPRAHVAPSFLFPFGVIGGAIAFGYLVVLVWSRTDWPQRMMALVPASVAVRARSTRVGGVGDDTLDGLAALVMALRALLLAVMVVGAAVGGNAWTVPPGFAICLLLGTAVSIYGLFVFYFPLHRFGLVAAVALVLAVITGVGGASHRVREMSYTLQKPSAGDATPVTLGASGLADDAAVLKSWLATYGTKGPLVVVAVDGGGVRAATWAMAVLTELEQELGRGFPSQVRVVTGASGGMLGAAYYVGSLQMTALSPTPMHLDARGNLITTEDLRQDVARDSLTPLSKRLVLHDVFPGLAELEPDRGDALQEAWRASTRGVFGQTVRSLQAGEVAGWRPSLVISPMIVEDGRRLLISNLDLEALATEATPQRALGRSAIELARTFPDAANLRLGTAARMSATFPYVMPAIELPTAPPLRVVDAGYYDEHGVALAAAWLMRHSMFLRRNVERVILIEVPDALASLTKSAPCNDRRSLLATGFSGFTTPLEGILSGRDALSAYGNDELIETVAGALNTEERPDRFVSVSFEPPYERTECGRCARPEDEVPLSWSINSRDRERLLAGMNHGRNVEQRARLRAWWTPAVAGRAGD